MYRFRHAAVPDRPSGGGRAPLQDRPRADAVTVTIVHSMPGRMRLRVAEPLAARGPEMARRLLSHPKVTDARWSPGARSLTINFSDGFNVSSLGVASGALGRDAKPASKPGKPSAIGLIPPAVSVAAAFYGFGPFGHIALELVAVPLLRRVLNGVAAPLGRPKTYRRQRSLASRILRAVS